MPVNKDPKKRRRATQPEAESAQAEAGSHPAAEAKPQGSFEETEADREKALADAEWKNLWDATEVIDMDKW
jgi:hypothetical protein